MKINCKICGKEMEVRQTNHCLCSDECRKINRKIRDKEFQKSDKYQISLEKCHKRYYEKMRKRKRYCKFCGREIDKNKSSNAKCDMCYLEKLFVEKDKKEKKRLKKILYNRGYDMETVRYLWDCIFKKGDNNDKL